VIGGRANAELAVASATPTSNRKVIEQRARVDAARDHLARRTPGPEIDGGKRVTEIVAAAADLNRQTAVLTRDAKSFTSRVRTG